jgi:hypothetical protein
VTLHTDLLEQAAHLAVREPKRPRQASLRRAVSSAYYALFHLLANEAVQVLAPSSPSNLRSRVRRAFAHNDMKSVCQQFGKGSAGALGAGTVALVAPPLESQIVFVARVFVELQEERHEADYDLSRQFLRWDVLSKIDLVKQAFSQWKLVRAKANARVFLAALLLQRHWNR